MIKTLFKHISKYYKDTFVLAIAGVAVGVLVGLVDAAFGLGLNACTAIRTKYLQPALSLVNPQFEIAPRMYLNDHDKPILFYKAGLKEEDMEMIKKRNLYIFQQE